MWYAVPSAQFVCVNAPIPHIPSFPCLLLVQAGYTPDVIFLDSAHEIDETYIELALYYKLLLPGGKFCIMGTLDPL